MDEFWAWFIVGVCCYGIGYLTIGIAMNYIWRLWAHNKVGQFWWYGICKGIQTYYPGVWDFMRNYNSLYTFIRWLFWPIMIPLQLRLQTRVLNRMSSCKYYY